MLDATGSVLGMVHNVFPASEHPRRGTVFNGGMLCVNVRALQHHLAPLPVSGWGSGS